jgi:hypothetical protein
MMCAARPKTTDKTVIRAKAKMAPAKTKEVYKQYYEGFGKKYVNFDEPVSLGLRIAIMAAMKNVLSPSSETMMTEKEAMKA